MRLLLIRHGETVDNVAGRYAGHTDSALTNHGVLQAKRLGTYLATTSYKASHIFSSDLQRAVNTAEAVRVAQSHNCSPKSVTKLKILREKDFGFYEGKGFFARPKTSNKRGRESYHESNRPDLVEPGFKEGETKEAMTSRMDSFVDEHLLDLIDKVPDDQSVVIVAHGIILLHLWRCILYRFLPANVAISPNAGAVARGYGLEYLGAWSNTGFWDLEVKQIRRPAPVDIDRPAPADTQLSTVTPEPVVVLPALAGPVVPTMTTPKLLNMSLLVKAVNNLEHLMGLKKTGGGFGNVKHDSSQKTMDSFFQEKRKIGD